MRTRLTGEFLIEQHLEKMKERNLDHKDAFEYMLSLIFCNTTQIENCVSRTLASNMEICKLLTDIRGSKCCIHDTKFIELHKQPNYFALLPSEYLSKQIDLRKPDNNIYCTQYSDLWWELRRTALLTGSTIMTSLRVRYTQGRKATCECICKEKASTRFHGRSEKVHTVQNRK